MTNLEKFEQVFGIKLDPNCIDDYVSDFLCDFVHSDFCHNRRCKECPVKDFWTKEYVEKNKLNHGLDGVEDFWW